MSTKHYSVLIIGGGAAGVSTANTLHRQAPALDIALVEPSDKHYYQPSFTLIGAGVYSLKKATKNQSDIIHSSINWIKDYAETFQPDNNQVTLRNGRVISYDYLVVCPGLQLDIDKIDGLRETLGKNNVCCNYSVDVVEYTWETVRQMESGTALFTQPPMPIKCAGAPQKAMYLSADIFRKKNLSNKINVEFFNAGGAMFGVPFFAKALNKVVEKYRIKTNFNYNLIAINGKEKKATFETVNADGEKFTITKKFDMIHVTPPQSAPDFIKKSPLANDGGWVDVNQYSLQHNKFGNIFGLGDATSTPNAKTAAAVRKQVPIVVDNILNLINKHALSEGYDGYGSCPLTTSLNTVMLAEFSYGGKVTPSFPFLDPRKNRRIWWLGKIIGFPWLYWKIMIKGYRIDLHHKASYVENLTKEDSK
ncbi:MAG: NAD(P)/FAD-dependent oxidoreductase [Piscirickettsiaceae bacterium]|nr:NAD(P)/FAD-dependent oxidoreductase [Piscirickettsiaceae bacterium]